MISLNILRNKIKLVAIKTEFNSGSACTPVAFFANTSFK